MTAHRMLDLMQRLLLMMPQGHVPVQPTMSEPSSSQSSLHASSSGLGMPAQGLDLFNMLQEGREGQDDSFHTLDYHNYG